MQSNSIALKLMLIFTESYVQFLFREALIEAHDYLYKYGYKITIELNEHLCDKVQCHDSVQQQTSATYIIKEKI